MRYLVMALLFCMNFSAMANTHMCPAVSDIKLTPGEYAWISRDSLFEGYFASPQMGRGLSSHVVNFTQARWMQLTNLPDSPGIVECDYAGNYDGEVIRFVQAQHQTAPKPLSQYWGCSFAPDYPGTQCACAGSVAQCAF